MTNWMNKSIGFLGWAWFCLSGRCYREFLWLNLLRRKIQKRPNPQSAKAREETVAPSDKQIADAKAKGMVWVNLSSKIYHKEGQILRQN